MSKKDFEAIAKILREEKHNHIVAGRIRDRLADYFAEQNPRFDRKKFIAASVAELRIDGTR